jgi:hypothetical protein
MKQMRQTQVFRASLHAIRTFFTSVAVVALAGCIPVAPLVYVPTSSDTHAVPGRMCEPDLKTEVFSGLGVTVNLVLRPRGDALAGSLQVDVAAGRTAKLSSSELTITEPDGSSVSTLGAGRYRPADVLYGFTLAEFPFAVSLRSSPKQISLSLPPIDIDGTVVPLKPIPLELRRRPMLVGLCQ